MGWIVWVKKEQLEYHCFVSSSILDGCHLYPFMSAGLRLTDKNVNERGNIISHYLKYFGNGKWF